VPIPPVAASQRPGREKGVLKSSGALAGGVGTGSSSDLRLLGERPPKAESTAMQRERYR